MDVVPRFRIPSSKIVNDTVDGEAIILNLDTGTYYSLDGVGAIVWDQLKSGLDLTTIQKNLTQIYPNHETEIVDALNRLLQDLQTEALIVPLASGEMPTDATAPEVAGNSLAPPSTFTPPLLQKYTDIQNLLLFDPIHDVDEQGWPTIRADLKAE